MEDNKEAYPFPEATAPLPEATANINWMGGPLRTVLEARPNHSKMGAAFRAGPVFGREDISEPGDERVTGTEDFQNPSFLKRGWEASVAVALIPKVATCFLLADDLVITNFHVFRSAEWAKGESVVFNYEEDDKGVILPNYESFKLLPDSFFYANEDLDYAIVRVENNPGDKYGFIDISKPGRKTLDTRVNIVQHPKAGPKKIAIRENGLKLWDPEKNIIQYYTDTEHGSSGSPVFNDTWDIIGLHCRHNKSNEDKGEIYYNEAYTIDSIRTDITNKYPDLLPKTQP